MANRYMFSLRSSSILSALSLLSPIPVAADGATAPHAVVIVCSSVGSSGTNLLALYVQAISSDDPVALAAVGHPTQPPPGIECGVALAQVLSVGYNDKGKPPGPVGSKYTIQSVVPIQYSWVYTLTAAGKDNSLGASK